MRKLFLAIAALLLVLTAGVGIGPRFVDWTAYRSLLAERLQRATGLPTRIDGPVSLALLPVPHLRVGTVAIAARDASDGQGLRVRAVDLQLSLADLLSGAIVIRSLTFVDPVLTLDGWTPDSWTPNGPALNALIDDLFGHALARVAGRDADDGSTGATTEAISIDRLSIRGGIIRYGTGAQSHRIERITATAIWPGYGGRVGIDGSFDEADRNFSFSGSAAPRLSSTMPIQVDLVGPSQTTLAFDGTLERGSTGLGVTGTLRLGGPSLAAAALAFTGGGDGLPSSAFALSGPFHADAEEVRLVPFEGRIGAVRGSGTARLAVTSGRPSFAIKLSAPTLDLDRMTRPSLAAAGWLGALPVGWSGVVQATAEAAIWRGEPLRQIRAKANFAHDRVSVEELGAQLPGGGQVTVNATVVHDPVPRAEGALTVSADNLRSVATWLGVSIDGVPADHLRRAVLSTRFKTQAGRLDLDGIDLEIDSTRITGAVDLVLRDGSRPTADARLTADSVNLDGYLPQDIGAEWARSALALAASADFSLDATVGAMVVRGRPLENLRLRAAARDGTITVADAGLADPGGDTAELSGTIGDVAAAVPAISARFAMRGDELARVVLPGVSGGIADIVSGPFSVGGQIATGSGGLRGKVQLTLLGGTAALDGLVTLGAEPRVDAQVRIDHPSYARLLHDLAAGDATEAGPIRLAAHIGGRLGDEPATISLDSVSLAVGTQTVAGHARLVLGDRPHLDADLSAGSVVLDGLIPNGGRVFGLPKLDAELDLAVDRLAWSAWTLERAKARLALEGGAISLTGLQAGFLGGALRATADLSAGRPRQLRADLHVAGLDLGGLLGEGTGNPFFEGKADAELAVTATGNRLPELIDSLSGRGSIDAAGGSLAGIDLHALGAVAETAIGGAGGSGLGGGGLGGGGSPTASLPKLLQGVLHGTTAFSRLTGHFTIADGVARSRDLSLSLDGGEARGSLTIDLPAWRLSGGIELRPVSPEIGSIETLPPVMMLISGPIDSPHREFDLSPIETDAKARSPQVR